MAFNHPMMPHPIKRWLPLLLLGVMGWAAAGCQASDPGPPPFSYGVDAYPAKLGTRYVMRFREYQGGRLLQSWTERLRLDTVRDDLLGYADTVSRGGEKAASRMYVLRRSDALYLINGPLTPPLDPSNPRRHSLDGAMLLFQFPLVPDRYWEFNYAGTGQSSRQVVGMEAVTVPAGRFTAVKIKEARPDATGFSWFVPGIGVVKSDLDGRTRFVKELLRFAPGK